MSAVDDWRRVLRPTQRVILDALGSPEVHAAIAAVLDPPSRINALGGSELTFAEDAALNAALAALDEIS